MKKIKLLCYHPSSILVLLLLACGNTPPAPKTQPGSPSWASGYPKAPFGATSVDVTLKTDIQSNAFWVIADQPLTLTPEEVKTQATAPTNPAIKFKGISALAPNTEKTEAVMGLLQKKKYYAYVVSESVADTKLQDNVSAIEFTTNERQALGQYTSTAENRQCLFLMYRPENVMKYPGNKYPLLVFLGGNGEVASQGQINMIRNGSLTEFINNGNDVPMMVMSIQHINTNWNTKLIDEGISHALANYPVDDKKIYLTGISGGGFGAWYYAGDYPARLAALVPISGGGNTGKACGMKGVPVWTFTNNTDSTVPVTNTANIVNAYNACSPPTAAKYDKFTDDGHDCWRRVYDKNHGDWSKGGIAGTTAKPDIYTWLLSKSK
ncbi:MAG: hypothetical protein ACK514_18165 [Bacteroidota bacterium]|jgi:predicted peptidase|nr:hypothetical protein [Cytophagales bacterium]MCE2958439.1 hypothetical protein [Flammeovirgaceae bacterium]MCZ8070104.1 hypothetical protein [Cytophagales bacterium]